MKLYPKIAAILLAGIVTLFFVNIPVFATNLAPIGVMDTPGNGSTVKGQVEVNGWLLDGSGVAKVEILVNGNVAGQAAYGAPRPDVQNAYPQYSNGNAGYHFTLDTSKFNDGTHTVSVKSTSITGQVTTLPGKQVTFANVKGYLDSPNPGATLTGTHNLSGWLLDSGGVAKIEVLVDGNVAGQAAYGAPRPDVQRAYPQYNNGNAGFHYALDTTKFKDGTHTIAIRETSMGGRVTTLPGITITTSNVKGILDNPAPGSTLNGTHQLSGWFLDASGVAKIEVLVDGNVDGQAEYGGSRPDVQKAYPQYNNGNSGFYYSLDTTKYGDGSHTIAIRETGANGIVTTLRAVTVSFSNIKGYVDQPSSGANLNGKSNKVSGWFLDASGVSKIEVLVDGVVAGEAVYGDERSDVKSAHPQFNNGNSGFHYLLDTTKFSNGPHSITVRETGMNGRMTSLQDIKVTISNEVRGYLDSPVSNSRAKGVTNVTGWFLDPSGVSKIEVLVDGQVVGEAVYGDERSDVKRAFPEYDNGNAGFHYSLDTTQFADGKHTVTIRATGMNGQIITLPESSVTIENFKGYLDSPAPSTILRENINVSGWLLDLAGVESIEILVDGVVVGQADYGKARPDVLKKYPEYNNGNSGFQYTLDTTQFPQGRHMLTIRETAKNGRVMTLSDMTVIFNQAKTVFLDPGHGGSDPGATFGSYHEADLNLAVAKKVQALLVNRGYTVYMSRNNDTTVALLDRPKMANDLKADIFVSIHTNSGPSSASGIESYFYKYNPDYPSTINGDMHNNPERIANSMRLTSLIQDNMVQYTGAGNRGTDGASFAVIRESAMPATLLEMGFISNSTERQKLFTDSYQNSLAKAIADGIDEYFRIY
ncbi:Ig-like domain-containing protein [Neobacillus niacini]|uniref:Ig-like domain-containing protein n=1 Tax=Neobacillus niacini TaxID=86668 RepID=UPI0021CB2DE1|nr:Ig-like domain-containing protein [Neobacillus niacini]MCM3763521.1 Ig-like domain-containing protein [Neobacillus niacini]